MAYCINCGAVNSLEPAQDMNGERISVFYEFGEYNEYSGNYDEEGSLDVDVCKRCNHEQIDISSQTGNLCSKRKS